MSDEPREIVIVRRRHGGDHDEAHGGVWKVAFADFMTAMMAFFLVLWIVNSSTKETRATVARYFNPIRLSDTTPARKGLQEPRELDFNARATDYDKNTPDSPTREKVEKPPAVGAAQTQGEKADGAAAVSSSAKGDVPPRAATAAKPASETYRDPFEPIAPVRVAPAEKSPAPSLSSTPSPSVGPHTPPGQAQTEAAAIERAVTALARQAVVSGGPTVELRETPEGTLISLTDRADFGMFAVGSSDPNAALLRLVTELGTVLKPSRAPIVVRGHTDARRFRKGASDNWRLSTERAQAAADMLLRGGLDERRIERIEGYADHKLRNAKDPEAAENRRVEILLRKGGA